jgi:hypothetical protein
MKEWIDEFRRLEEAERAGRRQTEETCQRIIPSRCYLDSTAAGLRESLDQLWHDKWSAVCASEHPVRFRVAGARVCGGIEVHGPV